MSFEQEARKNFPKWPIHNNDEINALKDFISRIPKKN